MNNTVKRFLNPTQKQVGRHLLFALWLLLPLSSFGGGVVTNCTEANLRAAMAGGGLVTFACDGTIPLSNTITNAVSTVLDGSGHQVTISGGGVVRVFAVATNSSLGVLNLTIANGRGRKGGGLLNLGGRINLTGVQVVSNLASFEVETSVIESAAGGGILNRGGNVDATNCVFLGNRAEQLSSSSTEPSRTRGGAVCNEDGVVRLDSCSFVSNSVVGAPGPFNIQGTAHEASGGAVLNSGTLEGNLCTFLANSAVGGVGGGNSGQGGAANGGALCNLGTIQLKSSTFASNSASGGIGGIGASGTMPGYPYNMGGGGGGGGSANGGALFNSGAATISSCLFTGNIGNGGNGGAGGAGLDIYPIYPGGDGGTGGDGGFACGAICDINALCLLTNCSVSFNSGFPGVGGVGGRGGAGIPGGNPGRAGASGLAAGGLRSIGTLVVNSRLITNAPGNCTGTFTDGGLNTSSDCSCGFTNLPLSTSMARPFYLLHNFTGQEAQRVDAHPQGQLTLGADETFYGCSKGGSPPWGSVFKVGKQGADGNFGLLKSSLLIPSGVLWLSGDALYGTTASGGQSNRGTIYRINTDGSGFQVLHSFTGGAGGDSPSGGVILSEATLYGTTESGGNWNYGTVFRIGTNGSAYSILKHFPSATNGHPRTDLIRSGTMLFGTTWGFDSSVFKINTDGSGDTAVTEFRGSGGPSSTLAILGSTLFGTTWGNTGTVFRVNTDGSGYAVLRSFPGSDSPGRQAGLVHSGGYLFGTTTGNGSTSYGTVFAIQPDGSGYTVLKRFNGSDGESPNGTLLCLDNTLYGTTENGGFYNAGVAFALPLPPPVITALPQSRTVEFGSSVDLTVEATSPIGMTGQWFFNSTSPVPGGLGLVLHLDAIQYSQAGAYSLVLNSAWGATTSAPVILNVIPPVPRKSIPAINLVGQAGSLLTLGYLDDLSPQSVWLPLGSVSLTSTSEMYFDVSAIQSPQRFYRSWQEMNPQTPTLLSLSFFSALVVTGKPGDQLRVDGINAIGPTDAWFTLDTVTLTNTSQLYFDVSAPGQPTRLYRLVPVP